MNGRRAPQTPPCTKRQAWATRHAGDRYFRQRQPRRVRDQWHRRRRLRQGRPGDRGKAEVHRWRLRHPLRPQHRRHRHRLDRYKTIERGAQLLPSGHLPRIPGSAGRWEHRTNSMVDSRRFISLGLRPRFVNGCSARSMHGSATPPQWRGSALGSSSAYETSFLARSNRAINRLTPIPKRIKGDHTSRNNRERRRSAPNSFGRG